MFETSRLILSVPTISEAPELFDLNSDPEVVRYTGDTSCKNISEAEAIINERMIKNWNLYKMSRLTVRLKDGTYLGWCGLKYFPDNGEVDLGYRFKKIFWGKGYATESSYSCLKYGFETLGLQKIIAKAMPENVGSIKVMQKLGMTFRGYYHDPSEPHAFVVHDMTSMEFKKCAIS